MLDIARLSIYYPFYEKSIANLRDMLLCVNNLLYLKLIHLACNTINKTPLIVKIYEIKIGHFVFLI